MAVRHHLIKRPPADVWAVLADRDRYADWVPGTSRTRPAGGDWPQVGSRLEYTIALGSCTLSGHTVVRYQDPPHELGLEVDSGRLGTARVAIDIRPWGEDSLVIVDEHPLTGAGGLLHNAVADALIQVRHRSMLARLADTVQESPPAGERPGPGEPEPAHVARDARNPPPPEAPDA